MDENKGSTGTGGSGKQPQEELRDELQAMGRAAADLLEHLVRVPAALAQIPLKYMPDDTADHARNAANEGFKAVKTLLDSISSQVDQLVADQTRRASTRTGTGAPPSSPSTDESSSTGDKSTTGNGAASGESTRRLDGNGE